ncbi:MAG: diphosphate--fructose-6-phosphate 1-phosphotransferase [Anaerolineales bacterium]|nr:diphosphate--fructose-6-phosphate 1-phosphotransferase [Anaerolineales bacterium]
MNALIAQCGGPTAVLNASLAGAVSAWQHVPGQGRIFGSRYGLHGLETGNWVDLTGLTQADLDRLAHQPGAALGASRHRPEDGNFAPMVRQLDVAGIGVVLLAGGNGTMAAAQRLNAVAAVEGVSLRVIGIPKTIDNDLAGTDVTPGYGSAARYVAYSTQDVTLDLYAMRGFDQVVVIEVMGRHAGWLAAAAALARTQVGDPPHLILLPETPVDEERVFERIDASIATDGICVVVAAEGVHDAQGNYWAERLGSAGHDPSGQRILSMSAGVSSYLVRRVQERLRLRCRQVRLNTAQRSNRSLASPADRDMAQTVGREAVSAAMAGVTGEMVAIRLREHGWYTELTPFERVIGYERRLPAHFTNPTAFDVTEPFVAYARQFTGPLPPAPLLWTEEP